MFWWGRRVPRHLPLKLYPIRRWNKNASVFAQVAGDNTILKILWKSLNVVIDSQVCYHWVYKGHNLISFVHSVSFHFRAGLLSVYDTKTWVSLGTMQKQSAGVLMARILSTSVFGWILIMRHEGSLCAALIISNFSVTSSLFQNTSKVCFEQCLNGEFLRNWGGNMSWRNEACNTIHDVDVVIDGVWFERIIYNVSSNLSANTSGSQENESVSVFFIDQNVEICKMRLASANSIE